MSSIICVENLSKQYQLGSIGTGTIRGDLARFWAKRRGLDDPLSKVDGSSGSGSLWALRDISFEVQKGEALGIIGRNGAGKSTLLKILSRITAPTSGLIKMNGRIASLLEVGTGFHPELTGRENVYLSGAILGMTREEVRKNFDEIVQFSGVEKFIDTPVKRYSSGMYVRLAFAVAAYLKSDIMIVDEVLAVGDVEFQQKCLNKMDPNTSNGRTVLFVSHNMSAIERLCSRVLFLDDGAIVSIGEPQSVINHYLDRMNRSATEWERQEPATAPAYFDWICLKDENRKKIGQVTTGTHVTVVMDFTIQRKITDLQLGFTVYDAQRNPLFSSAPQDAGISLMNDPGTYRYMATLPENLFMPQKYTIKPVLWSPKLGVFDAVERINFSVVETASLLNQNPGGRHGSLLVSCGWEHSSSLEPRH